MKTLLLQILHYLWIRRDNIYSIFLELKKNRNRKWDWKINFAEFIDYVKKYQNSGLDIIQNKLDDEKIITGSILNNTILENTSKNLILDQQEGVECVPTALIRMINYNTSIVINTERKNVYIEELKKLWILWENWSSVRRVSNYLRKKIMQDFGVELIYFRENYNSAKYKELLSKNYAHWIGWGISDEYLFDFKKDGDIDIENYSFNEKIKYNHLFMNLPDEEAKKRNGNIVENYNIMLWIRNIYENNYITTFAKEWIFFSFWYFFLEKINVDETKFEEAKNVWEYRKIAWKSVINNPEKLIEAIRNWTPDEAVACLEIIVNRKI